MRQKVFLKLLFRYVLLATISAPVMAIFALILFQKCDITTLILGLMFGLGTPGILLLQILNKYLPFININDINFVVINSLIPWLIWGSLLFANKKKWSTFVELFILLYTLYGALAFVLVMMRGT